MSVAAAGTAPCQAVKEGIPMVTPRQLIALKVVGMLVFSLGLVVGVPSPASATCSNHPTPRNLDPGYESVTGAGTTGVARRAGPHTSCILWSRIPNGRQLDM